MPLDVFLVILYFTEKIGLDFSCALFAYLKCQVLFSLKINNKKKLEYSLL